MSEMPRGSLEKCREAISEILEEKLGGGMACLVAPQIKLPDTDQELDEQIIGWASLLLQMRSDDAPAAEVIVHAQAAIGH